MLPPEPISVLLLNVKDKNCEPAKIDGCNASVIETTYAPYPGLRGVHNNEESANNIVSEDCVDGVVQEDIKKNYIVSIRCACGTRIVGRGGCAVKEESKNEGPSPESKDCNGRTGPLSGPFGGRCNATYRCV